jgi:fructose-specific phosphotransferase system IIC component
MGGFSMNTSQIIKGAIVGGIVAIVFQFIVGAIAGATSAATFDFGFLAILIAGIIAGWMVKGKYVDAAVGGVIGGLIYGILGVLILFPLITKHQYGSVVSLIITCIVLGAIGGFIGDWLATMNKGSSKPMHKKR